MNAPKRGPRSAPDRLRQLLVMLPWLMEAGEVPLADVADRYGMTEAQVTKDLELVAMCGLPPYVDEMIDVFVDDGMVFVGVPRLFTRPLRLTAPEGFALLASGRAAMELPGADPEGPLARGLDKLAHALDRAGLDADDRTAGVVVDLERPALTAEIIDATAAGMELTIDYFSPARGDRSSRTIIPRHVFADGGNWYLLADDDRSGERRTFRIDRIESMNPTEVRHPPDPSATAPDSFFADADLPRARLRLAAPAHWIVEHYPVDSVEPVTGRAATSSPGAVDVVLPVSSDWWLDRLLVRLGPNAEVLEPAHGADGAVRLAASILANYD
ncbi:helix-turn-helix transcriptional regulator [Ilumatobacter nonamiensis]|uniref:helix-turn-helix transcriptional regulator n=1 Tax=Ilumatobacter nonamiensis TaxID=467093 RepID=UPI000349775F|nr:WYL domain-containing protein [Ilumatobacter nonamiensis]